MSVSSRQVLYLGLAIAGLLITWYFNIQFMLAHGGSFDLLLFLSAGFANPAVSSLSGDLLVACLVFLVWLPIEAQRLGMRHWWLYLLLTFMVAFAFAFPMFLYMRERRLGAGGFVER